VERERKSNKTKGKIERKEGNSEDIIDNDLTKQERDYTEETKNHRKTRKKRRERSKSGI
jgi:hypothetical protein